MKPVRQGAFDILDNLSLLKLTKRIHTIVSIGNLTGENGHV
jgi:hypothetical protein